MLYNGRFNQLTIAHELIHFIQDVTGQAVTLPHGTDIENQAKLSTFDKLQAIESLPMQTTISEVTGLNKNLVSHVFNNKEFVPYINNMCHTWEEDFKDNPSIPLTVINDLIKFTNNLLQSGGTLGDLKDYMKNQIALAKLSKVEKMILMVCCIFGQHRTLLKKLVGNYFKDL